MIRSHSKQTPWIDFDEWSRVKQQLLPYTPTDVIRIRQGLARITTWTCRGRVPLSVQSTAQLIRIKLSDDMSNGGNIDHDVLRLSYCMAIVRLVNGIVEPQQRTRAYAGSVALTAERLGLLCLISQLCSMRLSVSVWTTVDHHIKSLVASILTFMILVEFCIIL